MAKIKNKTFVEKFLERFLPKITSITLLSIFITIVSLLVSSKVILKERNLLLKNYFLNLEVFYQNFILIFILLALIYLLTDRIKLSFYISFIISLLLGFISNFTISIYGNNFTLEDLGNIREVYLDIGKHWQKFFDIKLILLTLILYIPVALIIHKRLSFDKIKYKKLNILGIVILIYILVLKVNSPLEIKENVELNTILYKANPNLPRNLIDYQVEGPIKSFFSKRQNSNKNIKVLDKKRDIEIELADKYKTIPIEEDKKANIIFVELEAFYYPEDNKDFLSDKRFSQLNKLKDNSLNGDLILNQYGKNKFKTSDQIFHLFKRKNKFKYASIYLDYLKEEGYNLYASNFYNKNYYKLKKKFKDQGVNFSSYENRNSYEFLVNKLKEEDKIEKKPYFSYITNFKNRFFKDKEEYFNYLTQVNYIAGELMNYYEDKDPTVLVFYGSHKPNIGLNNRDKMVSLSEKNELETFMDFYQTSYFIWGNKKAKHVFNKNFEKEGEEISPDYLFAYLFEYLGIKGNDYIQWTNRLRYYYPVNNPHYYYEEGVYKKKSKLPDYIKNKLEEFNILKDKKEREFN